MAQAPTITITNPASGAQYEKGDPVAINFACVPGGAPVTECTAVYGDGTAAVNGASLKTDTIGPYYITVTAKDGTNTVQAQSAYSVVEADDGGVGGNTPATLNLTLGQPGTFAPFVPGVGTDYMTTVTAQILSTAGDAMLSVADGAATQTGHLVNGAFAMAAPLQIAGTRPARTDDQGNPVPADTPVFAPVGGNSTPTTLITYNGPINETDTVTFKQAVGAGEALRTGAYSKTLTFTLSTTNP